MSQILDLVWAVSKHLATGYLIYSLFVHRRGDSPQGVAVFLLFFGTLFPDILDKPLTALGIVTYGRSFAHSLITASVLIFLVKRLSDRWNRPEIGVAFGIGYFSHILVDLYGPLLTGHHSMDTAFLFWPILVEYSLGVPTPELPVARSTIFAIIMLTALGLWMNDGMPIVSDVVRFGVRRYNR